MCWVCARVSCGGGGGGGCSRPSAGRSLSLGDSHGAWWLGGHAVGVGAQCGSQTLAGAPGPGPFPCTALPTLWLTGLREEAKAWKSWGRGLRRSGGGSRGWGLEDWGSGADWGSLEEKLPPSLAGSWS